MMYTYPERKKYKYVIKTKRGNITLKFEQATAQESKDYFELMSNLYDEDIFIKLQALKDINAYYKSFIKQKCWLKWYNFKKRVLLLYVFRDLDQFTWEIIDLLHQSWKSIYLDQEIPLIWWKRPREALFDNQIESISMKTGIPTDQVMDRLTYEQFGWHIDKIIYNSYEWFDEGKAINDKLNRKDWGWWKLTEEDKADLEIIKQQFNNNS